MSQTRREHLKMLTMTAVAATMPAVALASDEAAAEAEVAVEPKVIEIQMLNKHPDDKKLRNVFVPDLVHANPGDTLKFISVDKGHNAQTDKNMLPEGAEEFKSKISKDFEVTVTADGTYGIYCTPHRNLGMVMLVLVGDHTVNYEEARGAKQKKKAQKIYDDIFARADEMIASQ